MKKHKIKIIAGVVIVAALTASFFIFPGGDGAEAGNPSAVLATDFGTTPAITTTDVSDMTLIPTSFDTISITGSDDISSTEPTHPLPTQSHSDPQDTSSTTAPVDTGLSSDNQPITTPTEKQKEDDKQNMDDITGTDGDLTITLIISCATILENMDKLPATKAGLVPPGGVIFSERVVFYDGESVFNVLVRETRSNKIHLEFMNSPIYNSSYIEGINNLYEFDCGEGSGWMYCVNGYFPNYGSSRYVLQEGDIVVWHFTCDRGADIGGTDASGGYNFG